MPARRAPPGGTGAARGSGRRGIAGSQHGVDASSPPFQLAYCVVQFLEKDSTLTEPVSTFPSRWRHVWAVASRAGFPECGYRGRSAGHRAVQTAFHLESHCRQTHRFPARAVCFQTVVILLTSSVTAAIIVRDRIAVLSVRGLTPWNVTLLSGRGRWVACRTV